ncbi:MAG: type II secretion system F family protein [Ilumatobacter sp.]
MIAAAGAGAAVLACTGLWLVTAGLRGVSTRQRSMPELDWPALFVKFAIAITVAAAVWSVTRWPMAGMTAGAVAAMIPVLVRTRRARTDQLDTSDALAAWAEMLRDTIASHAGLNQAIAMTASVAPLPIQREVRQLAVNAERMPLADALRRFAADVDDSVADLIVAALIIADQYHAQNLHRLLSDIAGASRQQSSMRLRIETGRARTYASVRSIVVITFGMATGLIVLSPDFLTPYDELGGQIVLGMIGALFVGAVWSLIVMSRPQPLPRLLAGVEEAIES